MILARRRGVAPQDLYRELRESASLRLKKVDGGPVAAVLDGGGAVHVLDIPSRAFFEFVDSLRVAKREGLASPKALEGLAELLTAIALSPGFSDELALGPGSRDWHGGRALLEAELGGGASSAVPTAASTATLNLADLMITRKPDYVRRMVGGLEDVEVLRRAAAAHQNILLVGPPGSGKTLLAKALAFDLGLPLARFDISEAFEAGSDTIGRYIRRGSQWLWHEGKLLGMMRAGGVVLGDELDSGRPADLARLHGVLDSRELSVPEHESETVRAHDRFVFVGTCNPPAAGGRALEPRMRDRFACRIEMGYDEVVEAKLSATDPRIARLFAKIRESPGVRSCASTRLMCQFIESKRVYGAGIAIQFLLNAFVPDERAAVAEALSGGRK